MRISDWSSDVCSSDLQESREAGVRREPFLALDHPFVALAPRATGELLGIGARLRLGHRKAGHDLAVHQRLEISFLLFLRPEHREDLAVDRKSTRLNSRH